MSDKLLRERKRRTLYSSFDREETYHDRVYKIAAWFCSSYIQQERLFVEICFKQTNSCLRIKDAVNTVHDAFRQSQPDTTQKLVWEIPTVYSDTGSLWDVRDLVRVPFHPW